MAKIQSRQRKDGGYSHTVSWIIGGGKSGGGKQTASETFVEEWKALRFKSQVEEAGHQWPSDEAGKTWIKGVGFPETHEAAITAVATFHDVATAWREAQKVKVANNHKAYDTLDKQYRCYEIHLQEEFGPKVFISITSADVEKWLVKQAETGAGAKSRSDRARLLKTIFRHGCVALMLRVDNPVDQVIIPKPESLRDIRFFRKPEWALFRSCLPADVHDMCDFLVESGARWGEAAAVKIGDIRIVDEDEVIIDIRRTWAKRGKDDPKPINVADRESKVFQLKVPKNKKSREVTVVGDLAVRIIALAESRDDNDYLFVTATGSPWRHHIFITKRWNKAIEIAGRHGFTKYVVPHMLRHTAAVWMLEGGRPLQEVSDILGHSSIKITWDTYGGFGNRDGKREAARIMADEQARLREMYVPNAPKASETRVRKPGRQRKMALLKAV